MIDLIKLNKELVKEIPELQLKFFGLPEQFAQISFGLMIQQGLTQSDFAKLANVDINEIHRLQGGSVHMGDEFYNKVFTALGVTFEECKELAEKMIKEY